MLKNLIDYVESRLITGNEFQNELNKIMECYETEKIYILYELKDKDGNRYIFGKKGEGDASASKVKTLEDGYSVSSKLWANNVGLEIEECEALFLKFWNSEYCDSHCGLPATSKEKFITKCNNTIECWKKENRKIAVIMMDLDHFKEVNTQYGHQQGTNVISEFGRLLYKVIDKRAILVHQSGDEFDILFNYNKYTDILELMHFVYKSLNGHKFSGIEDITLTIAIGGYITNIMDTDSYIDLRENAERAYDSKKKNAEKQRNSIRIDKTNNESEFGEKNLKLALARVIGNVYNTQLFHNIYLDYISSWLSQMEVKNIQKELDEFLEWINPQYNTNLRCTVLWGEWDSLTELSYIDIGFACLQGLMKNNNCACEELSIKIESGRLTIHYDNQVLIKFEDDSIKGDIEWKATGKRKLTIGLDVRRTVLVQAGYTTSLKVPVDIFYRIVRVDARPSSGGGLPDSWAVALSALITHMNDNPNFDNIVIYGDVDNAKRIKHYLDTIDKWDTDTLKYIAKKTYKSYSDIIEFKDKFKNNIKHYLEIDDMINQVLDAYKDLSNIVEKKNAGVQKINKRFMQRELSYADIRLNIIDGFRTDTLAHAFPVALEILRNSYDKEKVIIDQAGRELIELTNFKILLEKPQTAKLPEYYTLDVEELNSYYDNILVNGNGLFKERLEKNNQLNAMLEHVITAIKGTDRYATRRAIAIVQNEVNSGMGYSPLGLVAIWMAPRFVEENVVIDYSYTWRTVEALVGLPLSMYASVRFAEDITNTIREKIMRDYKGDIKMGKISYIAHSLHMFTDEESMNIARGIINEVSI